MSGVDPSPIRGLIGQTLSHYRVTERIGARCASACAVTRA